MEINEKEIENIVGDLRGNMHKVRENGLFLSDSEIETLKKYNISYENCRSLKELINKIDLILEEDDIPELSKIADFLAECNYYNYTNK